MPRISIDAGYVRSLGSDWQRYQRALAELRDFIRFRLLGNPTYVILLGQSVYEWQQLLVRIDQEEVLLGGNVTRMFGIADQVDSISYGGYSRPGWLSAGYFNPVPTTAMSFSLPLVYRSPRVITNIALQIYGRRSPGYISPAGVNALAAGGTYINQSEPGPGDGRFV